MYPHTEQKDLAGYLDGNAAKLRYVGIVSSPCVFVRVVGSLLVCMLVYAF